MLTSVMRTFPTEALIQQGIWGQQIAEIQHTCSYVHMQTTCLCTTQRLNQRNNMLTALLPAQDVKQPGVSSSACWNWDYVLLWQHVHITTALKVRLKWPTKNAVFSSYINCSHYIKKVLKKSTPLLANLRSQLFLTLVHTFITQTWARNSSGKHITKLVIFRFSFDLPFPKLFQLLVCSIHFNFWKKINEVKSLTLFPCCT